MANPFWKARKTQPGPQAKILALLIRKGQLLSLTEISTGMGLQKKDRPQLLATLKEMIESGKLSKKGKRYGVAGGKTGKAGLIRATLDLTSKGFGFATSENQSAREKDIFIAARNLNGASHGDTVLVAVTDFSRGRREGRVEKIVTRSVTSLCGIFNGSGGKGYVTPDNDRLPYTVLIDKPHTLNAENGSAVTVEIIDYGRDGQNPTGKVVEILGDPYDPTVQINMAIVEQKLRTAFPKPVLSETQHLKPLTACDNDRKDLLEVAHVTIDGADARDFDDAICVEKDEQGFTLYVSIADVSHYVAPDSALDKEAYQRGTSVYLPDRVLPMLPERLSNDLCSLVPNQPRPAFTAILTFDHAGNRIKERYAKSLICSRQRFTYSTVNSILYLEDKKQQEEFADLLPMLKNAKQLAALLSRQRTERGCLGFNIPEPAIQVEQGKISGISVSRRNMAHMLIEEFMLAANEAVAETLDKAERNVLFRIHEAPDPTKLESFMEVCKALTVPLPKGEKNPSWFAQVIRETEHTDREYVINNLLLRTMQQARYAPENSGHFGLAAKYYLHFTSPIRRYPDLVAHRALQAFLLHQPDSQQLVPQREGASGLTEAGKELSLCERRAIKAERNVHARLAVLFMRDKIGEQFTGIISGISSFGIFVELEEYFISGAVPLSSMDHDYFLHDAKRHRLLGERTRIMYQLGDRLDVILENTDILSKRITFSLAPTNTTDAISS